MLAREIRSQWYRYSELRHQTYPEMLKMSMYSRSGVKRVGDLEPPKRSTMGCSSVNMSVIEVYRGWERKRSCPIVVVPFTENAECYSYSP